MRKAFPCHDGWVLAELCPSFCIFNSQKCVRYEERGPFREATWKLPPVTRWPYQLRLIVSEIIGNLTVCSTVCLDWPQTTYKSSALLARFSGIHLWPMDSPHKALVMRKAFPYHDVSASHWCGRFRHALGANFSVVASMWLAFAPLYTSPCRSSWCMDRLFGVTLRVCRFVSTTAKMVTINMYMFSWYDHVDT